MEKACQTEKGMVENAIKTATDDTKKGMPDLLPSNYNHDDTQYYSWTASGMGWALEPLGTPPC